MQTDKRKYTQNYMHTTKQSIRKKCIYTKLHTK